MGKYTILGDAPAPKSIARKYTILGEAASPSPNQLSLKDFFSHVIREQAKSGLGSLFGETGKQVSSSLEEPGKAIGYGAIPFTEQLPRGLIEGLQKAKAGLTGGEFNESPIPDEYGAGFGRHLAQMLSQGAAVAPVAAAGGAVGGPLGALLGLGLGSGAVTPGGAKERGISALEAMAIPVGGKALGFIAKKAIKAPGAIKEGVSSAIRPFKEHRKVAKELAGIEESALEVAESAGLHGAEQEAQESLLSKGIGESEQAIGKELNKGASHDVRMARGIQHRVKNIENYASDSYKALRNTLKDNQFQMQDLPSFTSDMAHAIKNIKDLKVVNGKFVIANKPDVSKELQLIIDKAPKPTDTSASDFLTKYQDFRDARYDTLQRMKHAASAEERKALKGAYDASNPIEEAVKEALNKGLGPYKEEFNRVNSLYSDHVYPLRNNKIVKKALSGKMGPNMLEEVAGTGIGQSGKGHELVREIIKQDPELLRNILGQRYAAKPHELHEFDEKTGEFLYEMPHIQKMLSEQLKFKESQLEKINAAKAKKDISLKQKMDYEKQAKEVKAMLAKIKEDRARILKKAWKIGKWGAGLGAAYLGGKKVL